MVYGLWSLVYGWSFLQVFLDALTLPHSPAPTLPRSYARRLAGLWSTVSGVLVTDASRSCHAFVTAILNKILGKTEIVTMSRFFTPLGVYTLPLIQLIVGGELGRLAGTLAPTQGEARRK